MELSSDDELAPPRVHRHPVTSTAEFVVGEFVAVRSEAPDPNPFWIGKIVEVTDRDVKLTYYIEHNGKWIPDPAQSTGVAPPNAVLDHGSLITQKKTLNELARRGILEK